MLGKEMFTTLVRYHREVDQQLLDLAQLLPDSALDEEMPGTGRSIRSMFWHMADTDWSWLSFLETRSSEEGEFDLAENETDLAVIGENLDRHAALLQAWLESQSEDQLQDVIHTVWNDRPVQIYPWQALLHLMAHGQQHRAEIAAVLTTHGKSPGAIDLLKHL